MDFTLNFFKEVLSYSSIYLGLIGIIIAWQGLDVWKKQLKGNAEYDTSRRILFLVYKVRRGVEIVRNPFMSIYEMLDFEFPENLSDDEKLKMGTRKAYGKRFKLLNESRDQLLVDILEAEVLWGNTIRKETYELLTIVKQLDFAVSDYLKMQSEDGRREMGADYLKTRQKEVHSIIWDLSPNQIEINPEDKFAVELSEKIKPIEEYLKPYIHKTVEKIKFINSTIAK